MKPDIRAGPALSAQDYDELVRRAVFDCCKWTLTVGDTPTICRFPLLIGAAHYAELARLAEALAAEAKHAEDELQTRPDLYARLGVPQPLREALRASSPSTATRFLRVDFHPTPDGYRITEANSDVAGGFIEGSGISALWAERDAGRSPGDPAGALALALKARFGAGSTIGLMHLARYVDDRQVVTYLANRMRAVGLGTVLVDASQLRAGSHAVTARGLERLDAVFRFFPAEWLAEMPAQTRWPELVASGNVCNPVSTILTQSKRFPLVWPELATRLPTWRALLPETLDAVDVKWPDAAFVLKPAFGHEGVGISIPGISQRENDEMIALSAAQSPSEWVAQRKFELSSIETPDGPRHVCVGIYVVNGHAAGAYGRLGRHAMIDERSQDAVILVSER